MRICVFLTITDTLLHKYNCIGNVIPTVGIHHLSNFKNQLCKVNIKCTCMLRVKKSVGVMNHKLRHHAWNNMLLDKLNGYIDIRHLGVSAL